MAMAVSSAILLIVLGARAAAAANATVTAPDDVARLHDLYTATDGPAWAVRRGWRTFDSDPTAASNDPCFYLPARCEGVPGPTCVPGWPGVTCDTDGYVVSLVLNLYGLAGQLPSTVAEFPRLVTLSLAGNAIAGSIPSLSGLASLEFLGLSFNQLTGPVPTLASLTVLQYVELSYNALTGSLTADHFPPGLHSFSCSVNALSGALPVPATALPDLYSLDLYSNALTSTIPSALVERIPACTDLDLRFNLLEGAVPAAIGNMTELLRLVLSNNMLTSLPAELSGAAGLRGLDVSANVIRDFPAALTNLTGLALLNLAGNQLTEIPAEFSNLAGLTRLDLSLNMLSELPALPGFDALLTLGLADNHISSIDRVPLSDLPSLRELDLSNNVIASGNLEVLQLTPSLQSLTLANNRITTLPYSIELLTELRILSFKNNLLTDAPVQLFSLSALRILDLSLNQIATTLNPAVGDLLRLETLDISFNQFSGNLPGSLGLIETLEELIAHDNAFSGSIPDSLLNLRRIRTLHLESNSLFHGDADALPAFIQTDPAGEGSQNNELGIVCPALRHVDDGLSVDIRIDTAYHNRSLCSCLTGLFGINGTCISCPSSLARCEGGDSFIALGSYPVIRADTGELTAIRCQNTSIEHNPCNPNEEAEFSCDLGYEGRLCSQCSKGYYKRGRTCLACNGAAEYILPPAFVLIPLCIFVYLFNVSPRATGMVKIFIFYLQVLSFIGEVGIAVPSALFDIMSVGSSTSTITLFGLECLDDSLQYLEKMIITICMPVVMASLSFLVYLVYWPFLRTPEDRRTFRSKCIFVSLFFLNVYYFPVAKKVFEVFNCSEYDPGTEAEYLSYEPAFECGSSGHQSAVSVAAVALIVYVLPIPVALFYFVRRLAPRLDEPRVFMIFGFLYTSFARRFYWWEMVFLMRKFILAALLGLAEYRSVVLPFGIFLLLQISILLQLYVLPYQSDKEDNLEVLALFVLMMTYFGSMVMTLGADNQDVQNSSNTITIIIVVLNVVVIMFFIVQLAKRKIDHVLFNLKRLRETAPQNQTDPDNADPESGSGEALQRGRSMTFTQRMKAIVKAPEVEPNQGPNTIVRVTKISRFLFNLRGSYFSDVNSLSRKELLSSIQRTCADYLSREELLALYKDLIRRARRASAAIESPRSPAAAAGTRNRPSPLSLAGVAAAAAAEADAGAGAGVGAGGQTGAQGDGIKLADISQESVRSNMGDKK